MAGDIVAASAPPLTPEADDLEAAMAPSPTYVLELERLNRLYAALRQINQAIVRKKSQDELFSAVCAALVEVGGFGMAWIGWHDPATQQLVPVSQAGDLDHYLDSVRVYTDDRPEGRGPSGTAFRENRPYVCNDVFADSAALPWRAELERRGFRASAVVPIQEKGSVVGTLNVYAERAGFFHGQELALLSEASADISFALDTFADERARVRAEALAEREQHLSHGLIEAMPSIFYLYDEHGHFLRWNRNFESVSGYSSSEILERHPLDFFAGDDKSLVARGIADALRTGEASVEAAFVARDGSATPYFFTGKRIELDGRLCLVGMGIDLSQRKLVEEALRRSEARYRTTLDTIFEGCQLLGFDWRYLYLNPASAVQNRRPNEELLGRTMLEAWPGIEASPVFSLLRRCMDERVPSHSEVPFSFADGSTGWFDVRVQPVPEGIFILSIDITERKHAEQAMRELNDNLERKVAERTVDLSAARERAEAADRVKSSFLATMSHELRTPLNSILGFTGIVLKGMAGPLNAEQAKQLGMVQSSARHLLDLINDVLDISKIEAGQLEVRSAPFDLSASVDRVSAMVLPAAEKKNLTLRIVQTDLREPMESDRRRVEQILLNLLNNALKFTDRGGITLTVRTAELRDDLTQPARHVVRIEVADTGMGIKPDDLSLLFQPFRQLDSGLQRQHEGTGLGLAICRRLTELLGGSIHAESVWGQGSVFVVILPVKRT